MFRSTTLLIAFSVMLACACDDDDKPGADSLAGDTAGGALDADGDGFLADDDCDDNDDTVHPGATEICDGIDNDCDGEVDEEVTTTYYADNDGDGFGDPDDTQQGCEKPTGYVPSGTDCDDDEPNAYPGNTEVCDYIDNNCDGQVDEGVSTVYYADSDGDGYGDPDSATESCELPDGYVENDEDCDDTTAAAYPGALEVCDEIDNDCNGSVDEGVTTTYFADVDGDGYGDPSITAEACWVPTGYADNALDCDDGDAAVNPDADEVCDGIDNDCDGDVDEADAIDATTWYRDDDGDSYGDPAISYTSCDAPKGYVADGTDCDDAEYSVNPGASEYCNGVDDDCDGDTDEDDAVDATTWYRDYDIDGYGDATSTDVDCYQPTGYVADDTDCDDYDDTSYPGGTEVCDGADNDCNGTVDDNPTDGTTYYLDSDADSMGDIDNSQLACSQPSGYVDNYYDCDDTDPSEPIVVDLSTGSSSGTGTLANPYDVIQDGIDRAYSCVIVLAGTYEEAIDLDGRSIDLWGVEGEDVTVIDADLVTCDYTNPEDCDAAVTIASQSNATPTIHGFTIKGGTGHMESSSSSETCADSSASHAGDNTCSVTIYEYCGGGVYIDGDDPVFYDVIIEDNVLPEFLQIAVGQFVQIWLYSYGGGVCAVDATVDMSSSAIYDNFADLGGGLYTTDGSTFTLLHTAVMDNEASDGAGGYVNESTLSASNTIVSCNDADTDGGGLFLDGSGTSASLINTLFYNDTSSTGATHGIALYGGADTSVTMTNSIVQVDTAAYALYGAGTGSFDYDLVYNSDTSSYTFGGTYAVGTGSVTGSEPLLTSPSCDGNPNNDDFSLDPSSPAVDAGNPSSSYDDVDGTTNDMGAYGGPDGEWE